MKRTFVFLPAVVMLAALSATAAPTSGSEYLLIPLTHAQAAGKATLATTDCATQVNFADSNPFNNPLPSQRYTGTAYPAVIHVKGSAPVAGYVMQHGLKDGTVLANLTGAEEGQTCAEIIQGKPVIFRKYTAVRQ